MAQQYQVLTKIDFKDSKNFPPFCNRNSLLKNFFDELWGQEVFPHCKFVIQKQKSCSPRTQRGVILRNLASFGDILRYFTIRYFAQICERKITQFGAK